MLSGAHNLERATSMRSCHCVCMDQCIFRTILVYIFDSTNQSAKTYRPKNDFFFAFYKRLVFLFDILYFECARSGLRAPGALYNVLKYIFLQNYQ